MASLSDDDVARLCAAVRAQQPRARARRERRGAREGGRHWNKSVNGEWLSFAD
jgi:hypothetical protein